MALTEEQLAEAQAEFKRREAEKSKQYHDEYVRREREAEERHMVKMRAAYPGIDDETLYNIYSDMRDFYE